MGIDRMTKSYMKILKPFCEEYTNLAEEILFWDKETFDFIAKVESEVELDVLKGNLTGLALKSPKERQLHFMRLRIEQVKKSLVYPRAKEIQKKLTTLVQKHPNERNSLKLSYKQGQLLSAAQIYVNYYVITRYLDIINKTLEAYEAKKK